MDLAIQESKFWIETLTNQSFKYPNDIRKSLQNGILLCNLINVLKSDSIPKYNKIPTPIAYLDNLSLVQNACICEFGLNYCQVFDIRDLDDPSLRGVFDTEEDVQFEILKKLKNVLITIFWLGKWSQSNLPNLILLKFHAFDMLFNKIKNEILIDEDFTEDVSDTASTIDTLVRRNTFKSNILTDEECQREFNQLINSPDMLALNYDGFRESKFSLSDYKDNFINSSFIENNNDETKERESNFKYLYLGKIKEHEDNKRDLLINHNLDEKINLFKIKKDTLITTKHKPTVKPKPAYQLFQNKDISSSIITETICQPDNENNHSNHYFNKEGLSMEEIVQINDVHDNLQKKAKIDLNELTNAKNKNSLKIDISYEKQNKDSNILSMISTIVKEASSDSAMLIEEAPPVINWNTFPGSSNLNMENKCLQSDNEVRDLIEPSVLYLKLTKDSNKNSENEANDNLIFPNIIPFKSDANIKYIDDNQDFEEMVHELNNLCISNINKDFIKQSTLIPKKEKNNVHFDCHYFPPPDNKVINNLVTNFDLNGVSIDHVNQSIVANNDSKYINLPLHRNSSKGTDLFTKDFGSTNLNNLSNINKKEFYKFNKFVTNSQNEHSNLNEANNIDVKSSKLLGQPRTRADQNEVKMLKEKIQNYNKPFKPSLKEINLNIESVTFNTCDKDYLNIKQKYSNKITEIARTKFLNSGGNCIQLKHTNRKMAIDLNLEARRRFEWNKNYEEKLKKQLEKRQNEIRKSTDEGLKKAKLLEEEKEVKEENNLMLSVFNRKNENNDQRTLERF